MNISHAAETDPRPNYGAPTRTRTADLLITNQLLYQLSYAGFGAGEENRTPIISLEG